jgi:RNA polymerase sigma-70 factor (ECF subfamily)
MEAAARREFEQTALPLIDNLYGAAMRLTRDPSEAEDLVQDAMVRAFRFWSSFQQGTNIKAWMFTILRNTFINGYHRRGRKRSFQNDVSAQVRSLGPSVAVGNSTSPPGPEEGMNARITHARIREALESLPIDYRTAVTLADLEGLSYKEIAEVMECPIGTVMSRIYRGRKTTPSRSGWSTKMTRRQVSASPRAASQPSRSPNRSRQLTRSPAPTPSISRRIGTRGRTHDFGIIRAGSRRDRGAAATLRGR